MTPIKLRSVLIALVITITNATLSLAQAQIRAIDQEISEQDQKQLDLYGEELVLLVRRHWLPRGSASAPVINFMVSASGTVSTIKLEKSSGSEQGDNAALKALRDSLQAIPELPAKIKKINVSLKFDANKFGCSSFAATASHAALAHGRA